MNSYVFSNFNQLVSQQHLIKVQPRCKIVCPTFKRPRPHRQVLVTATSSIDDVANTIDAEAALNKAYNLITTSDKLLPYDPTSINVGLIVWNAIKDIPEDRRPELINRLSSGDIVRLWKLAGRRYGAPKSLLMTSLGPDYSIWKDLPGESGEVVYHSGKAALPVHALGISKFQKAFFLASQQEEDTICGRVLHPTPIANRIYPGPMYFKAAVGSTVVPGLNELCDLTISYLDPDELGLQDCDIPKGLWPRPRKNLKPFNKQYTDYVRAAGPGVFVGVGFRLGAIDEGMWPMLYFAMAKCKTESTIRIT